MKNKNTGILNLFSKQQRDCPNCNFFVIPAVAKRNAGISKA